MVANHRAGPVLLQRARPFSRYLERLAVSAADRSCYSVDRRQIDAERRTTNGGCRGSVRDSCQRLLDLLPVLFLPGRQLETPTELRHLLVGGETWRDRRHLEEHVARLAKVDRLEVAAVANLGDLTAV